MAVLTSNVMLGLKAQLESQLGAAVPYVIWFEGDVRSAVEAHFSQATGPASKKPIVFFSLSDDLANVLSGEGHQIRPQLLVDFFVIQRSDGRSNYITDLTRLYGVSDTVAYTAFEYASGLVSDYTDYIYNITFQFRRRYPALETSYLGHVIRYAVGAKDA